MWRILLLQSTWQVLIIRNTYLDESNLMVQAKKAQLSRYAPCQFGRYAPCLVSQIRPLLVWQIRPLQVRKKMPRRMLIGWMLNVIISNKARKLKVRDRRQANSFMRAPYCSRYDRLTCCLRHRMHLVEADVMLSGTARVCLTAIFPYQKLEASDSK
jgi:hypothetical protein